MLPLVSKVPIMVIEGEHEIEEQAENRTFAAYSSRFAFPSKESGSSSTLYYSFNAGGIHFIMLGAYVDYDESCNSGDSSSKAVLNCFLKELEEKNLFRGRKVSLLSWGVQNVSETR